MKSKVKRTIQVKCTTCGTTRTYSLLNAETKIYRCPICGRKIIKK